jgi:L-methionine (R)-S-oxide reductase
MNELLDQITAVLDENPDRESALSQALGLILRNFQSETGTIHQLDTATQQLHLVAHIGLPPAVIEVVKLISVGKGIAGQTVATGAPVTICNIQKDQGNVARPGAKQTGMGGALCVPMRLGTVIVGTLGIGTVREYEYTPKETRLLEEIGRIVAPRLG